MNIFWRYEDFVNVFLGSSQNWASFRVISMHFGVFFKGQGTESGYFLCCYNYKYFLGCLIFLIFFGGEG